MTTSISTSKSRIPAQRLGLIIACGSILMMFAALSSAYIVRQAAGNWQEFPLPSLFYVSTGVLILSSISLHFCSKAFRKADEKMYKGLLIVSVILGFSFVILQFEAWQQMFDAGLPLKGNPAQSFVYVISGLHAAHVLGGIVALLVACVHGFSLPTIPTPKRVLRLQLTTMYWHFMDFLWIYLLLFFVLQR